MSERSWSIMTKSRGGAVSVIRDLTLDEARQTYERLDPWYGYRSFYKLWPDGICRGGASRTAEDGDIEIREVFGPPGWDRSEVSSWPSWPKSTTVRVDEKGDVIETILTDN